METVTVTYRLADIYGALLHSWRRLARLLIIIEALWIVMILGIDLFEGVSISQAIRWMDWKLLIIGGLVIVAFWFGLCPLLGYWRMRRARLLGPNTFSLVDRGIRVETAKSDAIVYWSAVRRTVRTSSRLYIFFVTPGAIIVPKRAFGYGEDFDEFVATAEQRRDLGQEG